MNAVRELLPDHLIEDICHKCHYKYRERLITPTVTIFHMINAAISQEGSFQSSWHYAGQAGQSGSLSKARARLPLDVWQQIDNGSSKPFKKHLTALIAGKVID